MDFTIFALPAVLLIFATSLVLLITPLWRRAILALTVQYLAVFLLVAISWPVEMALTKLVAGWIAAFVLSMALVSVTGEGLLIPGAQKKSVSVPKDSVEMIAPELLAEPLPSREKTRPRPRLHPVEARQSPTPEVTSPGLALPSGRVLRFLSATLVVLTVLSVAPQVQRWITGVRLEQVWGTLLLGGIGLLQLGFTSRPLRTVLGLLTTFSGFEILYAVLESSLLVAGLLSGITLALALAGAYLLLLPTLEDSK